MNADEVLRAFLPYHEAPNFPRILAILTIPKRSPYYATFAPLVKNAQPVPRSYIVTSISPAKDKSLVLLGDIASMVQQAVKEGTVHHALLTFWTATMVDLLEGARHGKGANEGVVKQLVESFVTLLETPKAGEDVNVGNIWYRYRIEILIFYSQAAVYPPLVLLTRTVPLADEPFLAIASSLFTPGTGSNPSQRMLTLLVILNDRHIWPLGLGEHATENLAKISQLGEILVAAMDKYRFEKALNIVVKSMLEKPDLHVKALATVLEHESLPTSVTELACTNLLQLGSSTDSQGVKAACKSLLTNLRERHPSIVDTAFLQASASLEIDAHPVDHGLVQKPSGEVAFLDVYAADISIRVTGVKSVIEMAKKGEEIESSITALEARLSDVDENVVNALYEEPKALLEMLPVEKYIAGVRPVFWAVSPISHIIGLHLDFISQHLLASHPEVGKQIYESLLFPIFLSTEKRQPLTKGQALKLLNGGFRKLDKLSKIGPEIGKAREEGMKGAQKGNLVIAKALAGKRKFFVCAGPPLTTLQRLPWPHPLLRMMYLFSLPSSTLLLLLHASLLS